MTDAAKEAEDAAERISELLYFCRRTARVVHERLWESDNFDIDTTSDICAMYVAIKEAEELFDTKSYLAEPSIEQVAS